MIKFAPREPALDGPVDDRLERVPVQPEQLFSLGQAAAGQKHVDREALKEQRKAAAGSSPRHAHGFNPMLPASRARHPGAQHSLKLHHIQMPPATLGQIVFHHTSDTALRAAQRRGRRPLQADLHSLLGQFQLYLAYPPRAFDPQKLRVMPVQFIRDFFHPSFLPNPPPLTPVSILHHPHETGKNLWD